MLRGSVVPRRRLPAFGDTAVKLFLCHVPNLSRRCLCFGSSVFPLRPYPPRVFFPSNGSTVGLSARLFTRNFCGRRIEGSCHLTEAILKRGCNLYFGEPRRVYVPVRQGTYRRIFTGTRPRVVTSLSTAHARRGLGRDLFLRCLSCDNELISHHVPSGGYSVTICSPKQVTGLVMGPIGPLIYVGSISVDSRRRRHVEATVRSTFRRRFPRGSGCRS